MFSFGTQQPQQQQSATSNFGSFNLNPPSAQVQPTSFGSGGSNLFGFGGTPASTSANTGGLFGGSLNQAQPQAQAQSFSLNQQTSTGISYPRDTNFMDLPADLRQSIEALEKTIQSHADASRPFSNRVDPSDQLCQIENKLSLLEDKIAAYSCLHAQQNSRISNLKKVTSGHWKYSENAARTIEASRNVPAVNVTGGTKVVTWTRAFAPNDPTASHYEEILTEMDAQLIEAEGMAESLKKQIEPFLSATASSKSVPSPAESVKFLLKSEQEIFLALQRRYNQIRDEIDLMRRTYRNFCSKYRRDSRDPFVPKVVESAEKELEREKEKNKNFFGVGSGRPTAAPVQGNSVAAAALSLPSATTNLLPSASTPLPTKPTSSLGTFSFGRI